MDKNMLDAIRTSLENFSEFDYTDAQAGDAQRHVRILPLYALSMLRNEKGHESNESTRIKQK